MYLKNAHGNLLLHTNEIKVRKCACLALEGIANNYKWNWLEILPSLTQLINHLSNNALTVMDV